MKTIRLLSRAAWLLPVAAVAASRSSLNYNIPTDSIDAGGRHVSSPAYSMEASLGGLGTSSQGVTLNGQPFSDAGNVRTVTDQTATNLARFYRVCISQP